MMDTAVILCLKLWSYLAYQHAERVKGMCKVHKNRGCPHTNAHDGRCGTLWTRWQKFCYFLVSQVAGLGLGAESGG